MYVPNYIPSPIEVPGNVTEQSHSIRLAFIRRVGILHLLSLLVIAGISTLDLPRVAPLATAIDIGTVLLILSLIRISLRATKLDQMLSLILSPVLLVCLGIGARTLNDSGWPVWGVVIGAVSAVLYALVCGRDFSFVGQFFLSLIVSCVALAVIAIAIGIQPHQAAFLLGANAVYLAYLVYDSASLLARRRIGEEAAAVVDLYRDVFNIFGYFIRVARHWRKHRIWAR